jgi:predicted peptidase
LLLALTASLAAQEQTQVAPEGYHSRDQAIAELRSRMASVKPDAFEAFERDGDGGAHIGCRFFAPKIGAGEKLPLVLFLHGAGGRGLDNRKQIAGGAALWALPEMQKAHPCFILAPQCPPEPFAWIKTPGWDDGGHPFQAKPAPPLALVMEVLDNLCQDYPVDEKRIYVLGASMGGYATWDLLTRLPERFAAAVPVCGGLADGQGATLAKVPIWIFHGDADDVVSFGDSVRAFGDLRAAHGNVRFTVFRGAGHNIASYAWTEPGFQDWLFAQRRP